MIARHCVGGCFVDVGEIRAVRVVLLVYFAFIVHLYTKSHCSMIKCHKEQPWLNHLNNGCESFVISGTAAGHVARKVRGYARAFITRKWTALRGLVIKQPYRMAVEVTVFVQEPKLPCLWLQAAKTLCAMQLDVVVPDGRTIIITVDSASSSSEICDMIAANINVKDSFGFSLHITVGDKVCLCRDVSRT